ncbi:MAG: VOC family protein, partial [Hydrogenophaga sp.]
MKPALDHLVVAADTLADGVAWCEATLGVTPGPGGEHALFGTHNRLLKLQGETDPPAYLEIIAIQPEATPTRAADLKRWFDLDNPALQERLRDQGPQLVHWVARVPAIEASVQALQGLGIERGPVLQASRPTPQGLLRWRISVRDDGQRLFEGALPTLIEWGDTHPARAMVDSGVALTAFEVSHPDTRALRSALHAIGLTDVPVTQEPP